MLLYTKGEYLVGLAVEFLRSWILQHKMATKENLLTSTRFVEDGSYLRLKTLTLSYNLASEWLKKMNIIRFQPYITAQNLLTLTKYKGFDPEVSQFANSTDKRESAIIQGIDYGTYPQSKSWVIGLNVEF